MDDYQTKTIEINENKVTIAFAIIPFSIAGTLIRLGLCRLQDFPGMPMFSLVYAQWLGCLIMGIAVKCKNPLILWYQPSHPAISTGLCGSITTFSTWQLSIFNEFSNYNAYPHTQDKNILAALSEFLVTIAMSLNGLVFGQHIGETIRDQMDKRNIAIREPKVIPRGFSMRYLSKRDYMTIAFGICSWLGVIFAAIFSQNQKELALVCVFSPAGALARWYLSFYNGKWPHFPIGTYIANVFATAFIAVLALLQSGVFLMPIACQVVQALQDGFCGCLSTISTFTVELSTLPKRPSYIYGLLSVVVAQCFLFLIYGTYIWSQGINPSCTR